MPDKLMWILSELKSNLVRALGDNLFLLTLYGSYARDEATADSDVDLLVVLKNSTIADETLVRKIVYDAMWQTDFAYYLSLYLMTEDHYHNLERHGASILKHIKQEGRILWQTT